MEGFDPTIVVDIQALLQSISIVGTIEDSRGQLSEELLDEYDDEGTLVSADDRGSEV